MTRTRLLPPTTIHEFTPDQLDDEAQRLSAAIRQPDHWSFEDCRLIAPLTLEINRLKKAKNAIILAHSYQTPDIVYGVADRVGDSYGLSRDARDAEADTIVFSSVRFMGETAKIVAPQKRVLLPEPAAGCSLADGVNAADVRRYRSQYPEAALVCYVNTSAEVKAECDVCVTSSNYLDICRKLPNRQIVFLPDKYMGAHLRHELAGQKDVIVHDGACVVHEEFKPETARHWRQQVGSQGKRLVIMAHPECAPNVLHEADFVGSTEAMMKYARRLEAEGAADIMPITECGTSDRIRSEMPNLTVWGSCTECPFMKEVNLAKILQVLRSPRPDQEVRVDVQVLDKAKHTLDRMFALAG